MKCLCEILIAEAKKVLLIIILKRKNLININFPHINIHYYKTSFLNRPRQLCDVLLKTIHRIQLTRSVDGTSFVVAYVYVCGK